MKCIKKAEDNIFHQISLNSKPGFCLFVLTFMSMLFFWTCFKFIHSSSHYVLGLHAQAPDEILMSERKSLSVFVSGKLALCEMRGMEADQGDGGVVVVGALGERDANHQKRSHGRQIKAGGFSVETEMQAH